MAYGSFNAGGSSNGGAAADVSYDNSATHISAVDVQEALDTVLGSTLPRLTIHVVAGSALTITDGNTTITGTSDNNGTFQTVLPNMGTWSVTATLNGDSTSDSVSVTTIGTAYTLELSYFSATLNVTAVSGAVVTATCGDNVYTGTANSNGLAQITIKKSGTYSVTATKSGASSNTVSVSVTTSGNTYTATVTFITLTVVIDSGSAISLTDGTTTLTGTSTGSDLFYLPNTGTWNVTCSLNGESTSGSVAISTYQPYSLELSYVKVFGVMWNYANTSTALSRLTKTSDPNGLVNVNITSEPSPAVGTGSGSSPFDSYAPWREMDEYNVSGTTVGAKKGESGFSRSTADVMVWVPVFYYKVVDDSANSKRYYYVADNPKTGFTKHPGSGRYIGRYHTISGYYSKTGSAPLANITRATARTNSKNKGSGWYQYDYATWCAVWLLYLVEFADWNSQGKIGKGYTDNNSAATTVGGTDSMTYHTGRASGTDGKVQAQYRHIEELWGNVLDWVDGANFTERAAYICTDPSKYADDTSTNHTAAGVTLPSSGWIKGLGMSSTFPWAFLPSETGGSETTYIPDYVGSDAGWRVLYVGGNYNAGSYAGLFRFYASSTSSDANAAIGSRLLFIP